MCGRFNNHVTAMHKWVSILKDWPSNVAASYNIAPTDATRILTKNGVMRANWGLIPSWSNDFVMKYATFNARVETAQSKPSFRSAWRESRTCLVPADGYYEWIKQGNQKQPYYIHKPDDILVFAGLWEQWQDRASFTILTEESKGGLKTMHPRMPIMLDPEAAETWLNRGSDDILNNSGIYIYTQYYPVSTEVNNSRTEGPQLITQLIVR